MINFNLIKFTDCLPKPQKLFEMKALRQAPDTFKLIQKSALAEFKSYLEGWRLHGEDFVPKSENPNSTFMEYFNYRKEVCKAKPREGLGVSVLKVKSVAPKIVFKDEMKSLLNFYDYMKTASQNVTSKEYYEFIDYIASLMPQYAKKKYPQLRPEIAERSGDIFRWRAYLDVEEKFEGKLVQKKFFDPKLKEKAIREYTEFVEGLTGKKVLIGCQSRMTIAIDELGILNNPENYKDVDYILFGHGKGSSLITDTKHPDTWRFSDNDESIWEFIETNVPKGKRVLVGVCEKDGLTINERRLNPQMFDKSGNYMAGIGNPVSALFGRSYPAKICESGVRHIIGHAEIEKCKGMLKSFMFGAYGDAKIVHYDL